MEIFLFSIYTIQETRPGPVSNKLIDMAINNDSNSYPPTNPSGSFTSIMAPIMFIIRSAAAILVITPTSKKIPPITSSRPIRRANSGGRPMLPKSLEFLQGLQTLVIHEL
ncbi:MAG TPA: hypothetical protein VFR94_13310 [Nitrososphaeraceae archaeon]|nr:hypothetical protein [Nitrososphaeraceae archaeon]